MDRSERGHFCLKTSLYTPKTTYFDRVFEETTMTAYDTNNIFAKIMRREIPCHKVYEDEDTLAFMDVMPQADGHVLVVPKAPSRNLLDADPQDLATAIQVAQRIARAIQKTFKADGIMLVQYNEAPAGQTVFHLHFHIIPRFEGVDLKGHGGPMADQKLLAAQSAMIRQALEDDTETIRN
jgi:histidine triad (HIT) family protein